MDQQGGAGLLGFAHAAAVCASLNLAGPLVPPAEAVLVSPNAQIARTVDAALRRSIPAFNPDLAQVQKKLENTAYMLRIPQRKPWGSMAADVDAALQLASDEGRPKLLAGLQPSQMAQGAELADNLFAKLKQLELAVRTQQPDLAGLRVSEALKRVADLELLQAPGLPFSIPRDYSNLPRLVGRAVVELEVERGDASLAFVDNVNGGLSKRGTVRITLDGYSAPITAGNFLANVQDGLYNDRAVSASYTSVIVAGELKSPRPPVPLEILPLGQFDPVYRVPLDVQNGELPVLPLSITGAVSMTHVPGTESYASGDEWFVYKFDKQQAGLAGLAFDEGTFGVFGYVTEGMDVMSKLQSGDVIVKAKVISGAEKLVRPAPPVQG
eukprot:CAMPEP_0202892210 /NCGR_PEP_ID=MMETSP1392-20130828/1989_1 /ASSEMBLY_ACC=CAM_ASM_000868 /TAXON_ID=225041 /ORGANISM="Chlamydomonas chlamydogama, Strain SAG 11-48b" /LENGTH=381 /DNA_ID=CAMNT_0049576099 /DNA_START=237 /DNA_END=1383 /DNA_ORIENTATION=+